MDKVVYPYKLTVIIHGVKSLLQVERPDNAYVIVVETASKIIGRTPTFPASQILIIWSKSTFVTPMLKYPEDMLLRILSVSPLKKENLVGIIPVDINEIQTNSIAEFNFDMKEEINIAYSILWEKESNLINLECKESNCVESTGGISSLLGFSADEYRDLNLSGVVESSIQPSNELYNRANLIGGHRNSFVQDLAADAVSVQHTELDEMILSNLLFRSAPAEERCVRSVAVDISLNRYLSSEFAIPSFRASICLCFPSGQPKPISLTFPNKYMAWQWMKWIRLSYDVRNESLSSDNIPHEVACVPDRRIKSATPISFDINGTETSGLCSISLDNPYQLCCDHPSRDESISTLSLQDLKELVLSIDSTLPKQYTLQLHDMKLEVDDIVRDSAGLRAHPSRMKSSFGVVFKLGIAVKSTSKRLGLSDLQWHDRYTFQVAPDEIGWQASDQQSEIVEKASMSVSGERMHQSDKLEVFVYTSDGKRSEDFICFGCISLSELAQAYPVSGSAPLYSKDQQEFISEIRLHELVEYRLTLLSATGLCKEFKSKAVSESGAEKGFAKSRHSERGTEQRSLYAICKCITDGGTDVINSGSELVSPPVAADSCDLPWPQHQFILQAEHGIIFASFVQVTIFVRSLVEAENQSIGFILIPITDFADIPTVRSYRINHPHSPESSIRSSIGSSGSSSSSSSNGCNSSRLKFLTGVGTVTVDVARLTRPTQESAKLTLGHLLFTNDVYKATYQVEAMPADAFDSEELRRVDFMTLYVGLDGLELKDEARNQRKEDEQEILIVVFENEGRQIYPPFAFAPGNLLRRNLKGQRPVFSDEMGDNEAPYKPPAASPPPDGFEWSSAWTIDTSYTQTDPDGWSYGFAYVDLRANLQKGHSYTYPDNAHRRRRRWIRSAMPLAVSLSPKTRNVIIDGAFKQSTTAPPARVSTKSSQKTDRYDITSNPYSKQPEGSVAIEVFEYQGRQVYPPFAFTPGNLRNGYPRFSDEEGIIKSDYEPPGLAIPPEGFKWVGPWAIDKTYTQTDPKGWSYAFNRELLSANYKRGHSYTYPQNAHRRRRKWIRFMVPRNGAKGQQEDGTAEGLADPGATNEGDTTAGTQAQIDDRLSAVSARASELAGGYGTNGSIASRSASLHSMHEDEIDPEVLKTLPQEMQQEINEHLASMKASPELSTALARQDSNARTSLVATPATATTQSMPLPEGPGWKLQSSGKLLIEVFENEGRQLYPPFMFAPGNLIGRPHFSGVDGRTKSMYKPPLPSTPPKGYSWQGEWTKDCTYVQTDPAGWAYALTYALFSIKAQVSSRHAQRRRRKWVRIAVPVPVASPPRPLPASPGSLRGGSVTFEEASSSTTSSPRSSTLQLDPASSVDSARSSLQLQPPSSHSTASPKSPVQSSAAPPQSLSPKKSILGGDGPRSRQQIFENSPDAVLRLCKERQLVSSNTVTIPWQQVLSVYPATGAVLCVRILVQAYIGLDDAGHESFEATEMDLFVTNCPAQQLCDVILERSSFDTVREKLRTVVADIAWKSRHDVQASESDSENSQLGGISEEEELYYQINSVLMILDENIAILESQEASKVADSRHVHELANLQRRVIRLQVYLATLINACSGKLSFPTHEEVENSVCHSVARLPRIREDDDIATMEIRAEFLLDTAEALLVKLGLCGWLERGKQLEALAKTVCAEYFTELIGLMSEFFESKEHFFVAKGLAPKARLLLALLKYDARLDKTFTSVFRIYGFRAKPSPRLSAYFNIGRLLSWYALAVNDDAASRVEDIFKYWKDPTKDASGERKRYSSSLPWVPMRLHGTDGPFLTQIPEDLKRVLDVFQSVASIKRTDVPALCHAYIDSLDELIDLALINVFKRIAEEYEAATHNQDWFAMETSTLGSMFSIRFESSGPIIANSEALRQDEERFEWLCSVCYDIERIKDSDFLEYSFRRNSRVQLPVSMATVLEQSFVALGSTSLHAVDFASCVVFRVVSSANDCWLHARRCCDSWFAAAPSESELPADEPTEMVVSGVKPFSLLLDEVKEFLNAKLDYLDGLCFFQLIQCCIDRVVCFYLHVLKAASEQERSWRMDGPEVAKLEHDIGLITSSFSGILEAADCTGYVESVDAHVRVLRQALDLIRCPYLSTELEKVLHSLKRVASSHPCSADAIANFAKACLSLRAEAASCKKSKRSSIFDALRRSSVSVARSDSGLSESTPTTPKTPTAELSLATSPNGSVDGSIQDGSGSSVDGSLHGSSLDSSIHGSTDSAAAGGGSGRQSSSQLTAHEMMMVHVEEIRENYMVDSSLAGERVLPMEAFSSRQASHSLAALLLQPHLRSAERKHTEETDLTIVVKGLRAINMPNIFSSGRLIQPFLQLSIDDGPIQTTETLVGINPSWEGQEFEFALHDIGGGASHLTCTLCYKGRVFSHDVMGSIRIPLSSINISGFNDHCFAFNFSSSPHAAKLLAKTSVSDWPKLYATIQAKTK